MITYWSLEAVNIKKSLIISGTTNWNWIKFGAGILLVLLMGYTQKTSGFLGITGVSDEPQYYGFSGLFSRAWVICLFELTSLLSYEHRIINSYGTAQFVIETAWVP